MAAKETHLRIVAGIAVAGGRLGFCGTGTNTWGLRTPKAFPSVECSEIMDSVSGFIQDFPPRNLEGSRPRTRDRLPGIEHRALPATAQVVRPEGLSIALSPSLAPRDTFAAARRISPRPLGHPRIQYGAGFGRGVPSTPHGFPRRFARQRSVCFPPGRFNPARTFRLAHSEAGSDVSGRWDGDRSCKDNGPNEPVTGHSVKEVE